MIICPSPWGWGERSGGPRVVAMVRLLTRVACDSESTAIILLSSSDSLFHPCLLEKTTPPPAQILHDFPFYSVPWNSCTQICALYSCMIDNWSNHPVIPVSLSEGRVLIHAIPTQPKSELHQASNRHDYWFTPLLRSDETVLSLNRRREPPKNPVMMWIDISKSISHWKGSFLLSWLSIFFFFFFLLE